MDVDVKNISVVLFGCDSQWLFSCSVFFNVVVIWFPVMELGVTRGKERETRRALQN